MAIFNVSTAAQLQSALSAATGGDKIILAAGNYGSVSISNKNYSSAVTLQTSVSNPAHFDGLFIGNSSNLSFSGLDIGRALGDSEPIYTQLSWIRNSSSIAFSHVDFHGSGDTDPTHDGFALMATGVTGLSIADSSFTDVWRGLGLKQSSQVSVQNSEFKYVRSDGIVVASTDGISIDNNSFTDFRPVLPDHADAIQFWNTGETKGSSNISIKNNVIIQTYFSGIDQTGLQGIFISDPLEYGYKNILIENNLLYSNNSYNGITVVGGTDVTVVDNSVLSKTGDAMQFWIRLESSQNVTLADNITDNIILKNLVGLTQSHNVNLATNPEYKALLPKLDTAQAAGDLHFADAGYQTPVLAQPGPVSSMLTQGLAGRLSSLTGTSVGHTVKVADDVSVATARSSATLFAVADTVDFSHAHSVQDHMPLAMMRFTDHFVALP